MKKKKQQKMEMIKKQLYAINPHWWNGYSVDIKNPGKFEDIDKESANILMPKDVFDGALVEYRRHIFLDPKQVRSFLLCHSFNLGGSIPSAYTLIANGTLGVRHKLQARLNVTQRKVSGSYVYNHLRSGLSCRLVGQSSKKLAVFGGELRRKGQDYTASAELLSNGKFEMQYLQRISRRMCGGVNLTYEPMGGTAVTGSARYEDVNCVVVGTIADMGMMQISYTQKLKRGSDSFWTACLAISKQQQSKLQSTFLVGWNYDLITGSVKARIDTNGRISMLVQEKLFPNLSLLLSGDLDYKKNVYKFGIGATFNM